MDETVYEPLKMYEQIYKNEVDEEAKRVIDDLINQSQVSEEENKLLVDKYKKALDESNKADKTLNKYRIIRTVVYILFGIFAFFGIFFFVNNTFDNAILFGVLCILAAIGLLLYNLLRINKIVKHSQEIADLLDKKEKSCLQECYKQVGPLNKLFDFNMATKIIDKVCPMIKIDGNFNNERLDQLMTHYGYKPDNNPKTSTIFVQSGTLNENPFVLVRNRVQGMTTKSYTGTRIITWTETYTDSDGHTRSRTRSQTLYATVVKPLPEYHNETYLVYGNEAGSNLSFSRSPTYNKDIGDEKDIEKFVRKLEDDLERYSEKQAKKGRNFTPLANTNFEILFNALDRNNEVEFRLLFTPLAQNNEVDLITKNKYFGDDFTFNKYGPINYLHSRHIQGFDLEQDPYRYCSYDINIIRNNFISYVNDYFRNIYFELAPLLAIPIYQQHNPSGWVYDESKFVNFPIYIDEVMANTFNDDLLRPINSVTENIYSIENINKVGNSDLITIKADSFFVNREMELVPTLGGDGRLHNVPVYYDAYYPTSKESNIVVSHFKESKQECINKLDEVKNYLSKNNVNNVVYKSGLLSFIVNEGYTLQDDIELEKIIKL